MKIKKKILIIIVSILIFFVFGKTIYKVLKYYSPYNIIHNTEKKIRSFFNAKNYKLKIIELENQISNIPNLVGYIPTYLDESKEIIINNKKFTIKKFDLPLLQISKNRFYNTKGNFYLDYHNNNLFIASGNGNFAYIGIDKFKNDEGKLILIKSNLKNLILYDDFYINSHFGIRDILISDEKIYVSYNNNVKKNCFNTSILVADLNLKYLDFKKFFIPKDFVCKSYHEFNPHSSGGKIINFKENQLLFAHGEYLLRKEAQNLDSLLGKIFSINKSDKSINILSQGHRNVQGLAYDKNIIYSTEHGPKGGDEINLNNLNDKNIKNFGWPISSYGEHYRGKNITNRLTKYLRYPFKKSHLDYGFTEPLKYFVPSIGISELIILNNNFFKSKYKQLLVSSLGSMDKKGESLYFFEIENKKIINESRISINNRIRDMIYIDKLNMIVLSLETRNDYSKIAIISQ